MRALLAAPEGKRGTSFYFAGYLALLLSVVSWVNPKLVNLLNVHLFHGTQWADRGATLYVFLRLPIVALLVWTIVRFPVRKARDDAGSASIKDTKFFDPLMGLRALACLLVLMGHYFLVVFPFSDGDSHRIAQALLVSPPWAGVYVFFTLSGYLMGKGFARGRYSLDEAGSRLFFRNRLLRIFPVYVCGVILVSIYRYAGIFQLRHLWMLAEIMMFDYRGDLPISPIGALWSVSTEVQFYLLVPLLTVFLAYLSKRLGKAFLFFPVLLLTAFTAVRLWRMFRHPEGFDTYGYAPMIPNLDLFVTGMSINFIPAWPKPSSRSLIWLRPLLLVGALGFYLGLNLFFSSRPTVSSATGFSPVLEFWVVGPITCGVFSAAFIYFAESVGKIPIRKGLVGKSLLLIQGMGTLTYCLYVFHPEVFLQNAALLPATHGIRLSLLYFPSVMLQLFAVAAFFYLAVEKPFDLKKKVSGTALVDAP
jgi:peptidoglycan/LPS O-acetylase OafA/YrhL